MQQVEHGEEHLLVRVGDLGFGFRARCLGGGLLGLREYDLLASCILNAQHELLPLLTLLILDDQISRHWGDGGCIGRNGSSDACGRCN